MQEVYKTDNSFAQTLRLKAEEAKKILSTENSFNTSINNNQLTIDVETLNTLIEPFIKKSVACCSKALADSNLNISEIETVVLVGGSTRVPAVKAAVKNFFNIRN